MRCARSHARRNLAGAHRVSHRPAVVLPKMICSRVCIASYNGHHLAQEVHLKTMEKFYKTSTYILTDTQS